MGILTLKEQILLSAIMLQGGAAHGVDIRETVVELSKKDIVYGTLYNSLEYLIRKGYVISKKGDPTHERGGKSKTIYSLTESGKEALRETKTLHAELWNKLPDLEAGI